MRIPVPTRSLTLEGETAETHLRFRILGDYNLDDLELMIPAMLAELVREGFDRAFIDISAMTGEMPDVDRFTLAQAFVSHWGAGRRAAIFMDLTRQRMNKLFENAATNRAGQVRVGGEASALMAWLFSD